MHTLMRALPSVGDVLERNGGDGPGFYAMRLSLSVLILWGHSHWLSGEDISQDWEGMHGVFLLSLVPAFFALSGFLVTGSALRTKVVRKFVLLRILRIVPALLTEVTLSALVLGPLLTTMSLSAYFQDVRFIEYFGNVIGIIRFKLPGLFESNPVPEIVNQNLWTLRPEFFCYFLLAGVLTFGLVEKRRTFAILLLVAAAIAILASITLEYGVSERNYRNPVIVFCFFVGCFFYQWREYVKLHWLIFMACAAIAIALMLADRRLAFFVMPFLTYCVVYLGMMRIPIPDGIKKYDISYGVYLYGFPIQQALVSTSDWYSNRGGLLFAVSISLTTILALISWVSVERPFLKLKRYIVPRPSPSTGRG